MNPFFLAAILLIALGSQGQALLSPQTQFEMGMRPSLPPPCRPATRSEGAAEGFAPYGKASTYHLKGFYVCENRILKYGDRDSFADYVAQHAVARAKEVVRSLVQDRQRWQAGNPHPWALVVEADDDRLKALIERLYQTEMTEAMGPASVGRLGADPAAPQLYVKLRRVQDSSLLFGVWAAAAAGEEWRKL